MIRQRCERFEGRPGEAFAAEDLGSAGSRPPVNSDITGSVETIDVQAGDVSDSGVWVPSQSP